MTSACGVPAIESARLRLVSVGREVIESLLAGRRDEAQSLLGFALPPSWPEEERWLLQLRLAQLKEDPDALPWLLRALVLRRRNEGIGHINFHGPPHEGKVEIGYTVEPAYRRKGYAEEAVRAMFGWAREQGVRRFIASVSPDNEPSLSLIRKLGFKPTGVQWDEEDGEELVFELDATGDLG